MEYKSIRKTAGLLLVLALIMASSVISAEPATREWTFMLFMAADNNLESGTSPDINELEKYGSNEQLAFVAQIDLNGNFNNESELKWTGTRRFYIERDNNMRKMSSKMVEDLGEVDMATPEALTDFVSWARENYPAKRYALILWNHGTGWKEISPNIMEMEMPPVEISEGLRTAFDNISYNISYDDTSYTSMDIPTLRKTLAEVKKILGQPIDLIGFDACLMQMAEVAWAAAPSALFQVACPDQEPERGWPYDLIAGAMHKKPDMSAEQLGRAVVSSYKKSYSGGSQGNTAVVLSLLNLQLAEPFKKKLDSFCNALRTNISDIDKIEKCRDEALKYSYGDYIDLAHFLYLLSKTSIKASTRSSALALYKMIIGEKKKGGIVTSLAASGEKFANSRGLSIFFPTRQGFKTYMNRYKLLSFCKETQWFNAMYEIAIPNLPYLRLEDAVLADKNKDGRIAAGEEVTLHLNIRNLGRKSLKEATITVNTSSAYLDSKNFSVSVSSLPGPQKSELISVLKFKVSESTPVHSEITLNISLKGEGIPVSTTKTTFYVKEPFASTGHALLVMTDTFSPAGPAITEMLNSAGVQFDTWDRVLDGDLRPEVLKRYLDGWVLLLVQDSTPQQSLTDKEISALDEFLGSGGRLVLNGQDLAFSLRDTPFLRDRCKASFIQDDVNVHVVAGINGFAKNQTLQIFGGDGANNQKWPDEIDALAGAVPIIRYEEKSRDMADETQMVGPDHKPSSRTKGIKSSGTSAVKVIDGYRLLLFTFGIEAVNNKPQRTLLMKEVVKIMQPDVVAEMRNYANASTRRTRSVPQNESEILERTDLLSNIESRLLKQIRDELNQNPQAAQQILNKMQSLPDAERNVLKNLEKNVHSILEFNSQHGTLSPR